MIKRKIIISVLIVAIVIGVMGLIIWQQFYQPKTLPPSIKHTLTINSNPSGVPFTLDGAGRITPYSAELHEGPHTVVMPSTTVVSGVTYNFVQWNDNDTNPIKSVNLVFNMSITATYVKSAEPLAGPITDNFFFGVSFGLNTTSEAKLLIDKVKNYTNLFLINSWPISTNETALTEVCEYAIKADLNFMVFFRYISHEKYLWHFDWIEMAKERWRDKFLGIHLYDEPGGKQIDLGEWGEGRSYIFENVSDYSDAADRFVESISSSPSVQYLKNRSIPMSTSDYALYWFDYLAGYNTIFAEFGWNHSRTQQIALCRGAANVQNKQWGAIITWTYENPPYLESGTEMLQDMITAYRAGAKYLIVFNYPKINQYGILTEEHFDAMKKFWNYIHSRPENYGIDRGEVAYVLPRDYGFGFRSPQDTIWGLWVPDELSAKIWADVNKLLDRCGSRLDIVYDDVRFNFKEKYSKIYFWNSTID